MAYDLLKELRETRKTYAEMVDFCCGDQLILNNTIDLFMLENNYDYEVFCGSDKTYYDENGEEVKEVGDEYYDCEYDQVFQNYIITGSAAERFKKYTNELVIYYGLLDVYLLCVKHWGTSWSCVRANWKEEKEDE